MRRVVLIDDHQIVREGCRRLVESMPDWAVAGEYSTVTEALAKVGTVDPHLLIIDLNFPDGSGLDLLRRLRQDGCLVPILIMTMHAEDHLVVECLRAGANGYLLKSSDSYQMRQALTRMAQGGSYLDPEVVHAVVGDFQEQRGRGVELTVKERQVLQLLVDGCKTDAVAKQMVVSLNTIKTHLQNLYRKLGVSDRTQLVLAAIESGLATPTRL